MNDEKPVGALLALLRVYARDPEVQADVCLALAQIVPHRTPSFALLVRVLDLLKLPGKHTARMVEEGGVMCIVNSMRNHRQNPHVQERACLVLHNLAANRKSAWLM